MPQLLWQRLFLMTSAMAFSTTAAIARPAALHWERIHVYHLAPSVLFAKLGLTHSTKNGHTRDGKHGIADPTFPPGLTDVVPSDLDKLLLARGTTGGLSLFRSRVAAADVPSLPLHLHAELTQRQEGSETPFGTLDLENKGDGLPIQLSLGEGDSARVYQVMTRTNADGTVWVACRISLPLPPSPVAPAEGAAPGAVFVPARVWTDPLSRRIHLGETAVFEDLASFRKTVGRKLGTTGTDTNDDYTLRITPTPLAATVNATIPSAPVPNPPPSNHP